MGNLRFKDVTEAAGLRQWMNSNSAVWLDYDRDGRLDLYVTGYFRSDIDFWNLRTTRIMHNSFEFATNGGEKNPFSKPRERGGGEGTRPEGGGRHPRGPRPAPPGVYP